MQLAAYHKSKNDFFHTLISRFMAITPLLNSQFYSIMPLRSCQHWMKSDVILDKFRPFWTTHNLEFEV